MKSRIPKPEKFRITIYPHIREHLLKRFIQAGVLVEEIPGVIDNDIIYSSGSIEGLVGKLAVWRHGWEKQKSCSISVVQRYCGFERIFWPRHSLIGLKSDMDEQEYNRFLEEFERKVYRRS